MAGNKRKYHSTKSYNPALKVMKYAAMDSHIVQMFAAFAIALKENIEVNGQPLSNDDVEVLLSKVQYEWNRSVESGYNIADKCATLYDIDVRRASNDR